MGRADRCPWPDAVAFMYKVNHKKGVIIDALCKVSGRRAKTERALSGQ
jgi:hypothetical protein